jgi:hypothetical protein
MSELPTKACWQADDARVILANEALERNDAVFLATHSPVEDFRVSGSHASDIAAHTEQGLLDALSAPSTHHAFCVVEGEPGSGKSHLIRWLAVRWPEEEPLRPLLIQRLDGSLQGTLRQLQCALPEEHQHLFDQIGRPQDRTLSGRAGLFLKTLAQSLRPNFFVNPPEDAEWCARFGLAELLDDSALVDQWKAPERIIELLSGKKGKRDQELARFNLKDMADLEQLIRPLRPPTPRAVRFKNELKKEADAIRQLTPEELINPSAQEDLRRRFDYSFKLVDALNERHNSGVQNVLGISSDGLKELFLRLRRELRDRRLVLLLEDITAWEGVDRQLIDVLVTNVETRHEQDLCPMVSVVGVTPAYFQNKSFQANYFQRITHHIQLGNPSTTQVYQEVSALQTPESQIGFAARYLRATRVGVKKLTKWNGGPDPIPNPCESCLHLEPCHREFGSDHGIGLFPFTTEAITTLYGILRDPQHTATYQTPRGMLQGVLSPTLQHPQALDAGEYPGAEIETNLIPEEDRRLFEHGQMAAILEAQVESGRIRERMRRLIAYWGKKGSAATHTLDDGSLVYAGVRQDIYQAFGLPWLGAETPEGTGTGGEPKPGPGLPRDEKPTSPGIALGSNSEAQTGTQGQGGTRRPHTPDGRRSMTAAQLLRVRQDIARWSDGNKPERPGELNRLAYEILDQLKWGHLGVSPWLRSRLFTEDTVILRDTKPARLQHLVLERAPWVTKGIEAYQALRTGGDGQRPQEVEAHRRAYATMQRKLGTATIAKVQDRLPGLENGEPWDVLGTAAQVLLARAWLRGNVSPLAESWGQWRAVICDEGASVSGPQDRVEVWNTLVDATGGIHPTLRTLLRVSLALPQYQPDPNQQHLDTSLALLTGELVKALQSLRQSFGTLPQPASTQSLGEKLSELKRLTEVAGTVNQRLKLIPRYETERLIERARSIEGRCRRSTIRHHLQRVDGVVEAVAGHFPNQVSGQAQEWRIAKQRLEAQNFLENGAEYAGAVVEEFLDQVSKGDASPSDERAQALAWALDAPASKLRTVYEGLETAEKTISQLLAYVEEYLADTPGGGGALGNIHEAGARIQAGADKAIKGLQEARHA